MNHVTSRMIEKASCDTSPFNKSKTNTAKIANNALAELAKRLKPEGNEHLYFTIDYGDFDKVQRIIAELAKVAFDKDDWVCDRAHKALSAYNKCRAIAEEGKTK